MEGETEARQRSRKENINLILNIVLILLLIVIIYYIVTNIDVVKHMLDNPCKMCMEKTGGICTSLSGGLPYG